VQENSVDKSQNSTNYFTSRISETLKAEFYRNNILMLKIIFEKKKQKIKFGKRLLPVSSEYFTFTSPVRLKKIKIRDYYDFILISVRKLALSQDVKRKLGVLLYQVLGTVFELKKNRGFFSTVVPCILVLSKSFFFLPNDAQ
jgi:hypothetical protein